MDDDNKLRCDCAYGVTDYQAIGLLEAFKHNFMYKFTKGAKYEKHFNIGKEFDPDLEEEQPM
jgi:hypothetical protein